jgi:hypothetical protein
MRLPFLEAWIAVKGRSRKDSTHARSPAGFALIVVILLLAFGSGTAVSAAYQALEDMQARGEMDPTW